MHPEQTRNILLVGPSGVGKTMVLQKLMALLPRVRFGGYFGRRLESHTPLRQLVLVDGKHRELTEQPLERPAPLAGFTVFDATSLQERGLPCLKRALHDAQVLIIDEIGPVEVETRELTALVTAAFDAPAPVLAAGAEGTTPFLDKLADRADTWVRAVRPSNRATLAEVLADDLMELLDRASRPRSE